MLTRRLRYFNKPSLSYLRIPIAERIQKFSEPTTEYDIAGWFNPNKGWWLSNEDKPPDLTAVKLWRNPWDSYDGYKTSSGSWEEKAQYQFWPDQGTKNWYFYAPAEERYVRGIGGLKGFYAASYAGGSQGSSPTGTGNSFLPAFEYFNGYCHNFFWCYSWCELVESLDLRRRHSPIFSISNFRYTRPYLTNDPNSAVSMQPTLEIDPYPDQPPEVVPPPPPQLQCEEYAIADEHMSHGGLYGSAMGLQKAHEVNNCCELVGTVVRMFKGKGSYYLFESMNCPSRAGQGHSVGTPYTFTLPVGEGQEVNNSYNYGV